MKKLFVLFLMLLNFSAFAKSKSVKVPASISDDIPEEELVSMTFASSVVVEAIDGINPAPEKKKGADEADGKEYLDSSLSKFNKNRTVLMMPGTHIFVVKFNNGKSYTLMPNSLKFTLEAGQAYKIVAKTEKNKVSFELLDAKTGKSVTNPNNYNLHQKSILAYVEQVLDPVAAGKKLYLTDHRGKFWYYGEDLTVTVKDSYANEEHAGFIGFSTDAKLSKGTIYIKYNDDGSLTKDDFLKLKPEDCDLVYEIDEISSDGFGLMLTFKLKGSKPKEELLMSKNSFQ
ncbi:hypothetical protein [Treponema bryantii]|uniref:hypothetical protein n=1 Tax=Treponema bryantii TaxID=163 RepID=UPI0003B581EB|nr:hypothetical protein [Treponema bryantii]